MKMLNQKRFHAVMNFRKADRLPMFEWAMWWDKTIERWHQDGLPSFANNELKDYFGLDDDRQYWLGARQPDFQAGEGISSIDDYLKIKPNLYPKKAFDPEVIKFWARKHQKGEVFFWATLEGFFWFPRTLFGIEKHLYAFYDQPELMHRINADLLKFNLRALDRLCEICVPDFITFAEDMSYNHGPMISRKLFDEFMAPYYRKIVPRLKHYGILPIIDSDGDIAEIIPWFQDVGIDGFLPLERQAGVDLAALRKKYPRTRFIGGYDKMVMSRGRAKMRREFERLLPVMKQGGYIPSVDHQTPPGVSLKNYRIYLELLKEYCVKAADKSGKVK